MAWPPPCPLVPKPQPATEPACPGVGPCPPEPPHVDHFTPGPPPCPQLPESCRAHCCRTACGRTRCTATPTGTPPPETRPTIPGMPMPPHYPAGTAFVPPRNLARHRSARPCTPERARGRPPPRASLARLHAPELAPLPANTLATPHRPLR